MPLLAMRGVSRSFGGVRAVVDGSLTLATPGRIHGLIGTNGCGKSTMLKILSGQLRPDAGEVLLEGRSLSLHSPHDAVAAGISMVAQETAVAAPLTITENVLMNGLIRSGRTGTVDWRASHARAAEVIGRLGLTVDPRMRVGELRPDQQQLVEIARAISRDSRIVILDEPTSSLAEDRVEDLHHVVRQLAAEGVSVILVTHRLDELFSLADDLTVMRDGATVETGPMASMSVDRLVATMVGEEVRATGKPAAGSRAAATPSSSGAGLVVSGLSVDGVLHDVDVQVRPGEVVGLAGLEGSGRSVLMEAVFGHTRRTRGTVTLQGRDIAPNSVRTSIRSGLSYLPPDRKRQGLVLPLSARDNVALAATALHGRARLRRGRRELGLYTRVEREMRLRSASPSAPVASLSGGNQQKVALGKWLSTSPQALLLDEPTRGVDVVARKEIHHRLRELSALGVATLVSSSEFDELMELCDRIVVLFRGRVVAKLRRTEFSEQSLTALSGGLQ